MCMSGAWIVHTMLYLPRFLNVCVKVPFLRVEARKLDGPFATATLWPSLPFQTHFTLVPLEIVRVFGEKKSSLTSTVFVLLALAAAPPPIARRATQTASRLI